jgi:hypothetical protein
MVCYGYKIPWGIQYYIGLYACAYMHGYFSKWWMLENRLLVLNIE